MSKNNYEVHLPSLMRIEKEDILTPAIPVDVFLQEGHDLYIWVEEDEEAMAKAGLDWRIVKSLPAKTGTLRYAQSVWMKERYSQKEAQQEWNEKSPNAYLLKNDLEASFRFAFRKRPDLLTKVAAIEDGSGHADMVQDLSDLSVLGKANQDLLTAIGMDLKDLDRAANMTKTMAELLARVNGHNQENSEAKEMRDRSYTYLKSAVDEVRATGKYVFRKDPEKLKGFSSAYHR